jgi:hypothetical protein
MLRVALAVSLLMPSAAAAQSWVDALQAKDYTRAAAILQAIVNEPEQLSTSIPPEPFAALATLYRDGLGVERNPALACGLAMTADFAHDSRRYPSDLASMRTREAALAESRAFVASLCDSLSDADREIASHFRAPGCFAFGMQEQVFAVNGAPVHVGRLGISATDPDVETFMCMALVTSVRHVSVQPPRDAAPGITPRDFIEVQFWTAARAGNEFHGWWRLVEVRRGRLLPGMVEPVLKVSGWPAGRILPPPSYEMLRSGHVRWKIDGQPPRRGWLMLGHGENDR